ncbi:hypothetical protein [Flavobacterium sp. TSSA_36]|uniref:hypothetical protein n=1 Tax=Flavobacterium sp. TSSA_36 TaxID=3447669 RepID=UPI003F3D4720
MSGKIQVGYLVSYDYELLKNSIPTIYNEADNVFLAIDINRRTWNGENYVIDDTFFEWIEAYDVEKKIVVYEDNFYVSNLTTMECEIRERKMLSEKMGIGNWLIQIDCDEYFVNFQHFVKELSKYNSYLEMPIRKPIQIAAFWLILYKYTTNGILYVDKPTKAIFATNSPNYTVGRRIKAQTIYLNSMILHESLSRTEEALRFKLQNWGHNSQINQEFLNKWLIVDEDNYHQFEDFYYIEPERWKKLGFFPTKNMNEVKKWVESSKNLSISNTSLFFKNGGQWFKFLFKK